MGLQYIGSFEGKSVKKEIGEEFSCWDFVQLQCIQTLRETILNVTQSLNTQEVTSITLNRKTYFWTVLIIGKKVHEVLIIELILLILVQIH